MVNETISKGAVREGEEKAIIWSYIIYYNYKGTMCSSFLIYNNYEEIKWERATSVALSHLIPLYL